MNFDNGVALSLAVKILWRPARLKLPGQQFTPIKVVHSPIPQTDCLSVLAGQFRIANDLRNAFPGSVPRR